jgi:cytochrome c oxidase assembly protein subunit 15
MVPEMTGGVFWEHLHRLVAGGLILFFGGALYLTWREGPLYPWVLKAAWVGFGLLLVQALFGGLTVLLLLPDAVSTTHLGLAFLFLALTTVLAVVSSPSWRKGTDLEAPSRAALRKGGVLSASLVFAQSLWGAAVRHTDAGMGCPDVPLCLGQWIPPLSQPLVVLHFGHRVLGLCVLAAVLWVGHLAFWRGRETRLRALGLVAALIALFQVLLGFLSVYYQLAVIPVSLHTLLAATLLTVLTVLTTLTWSPNPTPEPASTED